jgi:hypothetical protein
MSDIGRRDLRIAVGVGHAHGNGGSPYELGKNREVVLAVLALASASRGFDVRCYTPDDGHGIYPGPPDAAAGVVVQWAEQGWVADIFHEVHHQAVTDPTRRGGFVIYPDAPHDLDVDVRDHGGQLAAIICAATGVPVWASGTMSERHTFVWREEHRRLSIFGATAALAPTTTRLMTEAAHYSNADDRRIMEAPGFADRQAYGLIEMYADLAITRRGWTGGYQIGGVSSDLHRT